jgi:AMMECR1 domain-containing protein
MASEGSRELAREPRLEGALTEALSRAARRAVASDVRGWLAWQEGLTAWRAQKSAVPALPFVALYAKGELRGCFGGVEGGPTQQLARAFLSAVQDTRFGGIRADERPDLVAEVTFMRDPLFVDEATLLRELELGTHGVGLARDNNIPVFLLPDVARDSRLDRKGMLEALRRKAGSAAGRLFLFEAESIAVRRSEAAPTASSPRDAAAAWLASLVRKHGAVTFARDARTGAATDIGVMHHARSAAVLHALARHGGGRAALLRGRRRLLLEIQHALAGKEVDGWPASPPEIAGTLAHAVRAGVELRSEMLDYVRGHVSDIASAPWHAGQVVAALGREAPEAIWHACLDDLDREPWAPWTVLGFHAREAPVDEAARAIQGLIDRVRPKRPNEGAVLVRDFAETAVTALTAEALTAYEQAAGALTAIQRARTFLSRWPWEQRPTGRSWPRPRPPCSVET